jgi:hypothetical protein
VNSTETPGGSGIPAGWYDDPSGQGLRWWDGERWTEHVHTAESAAAAAGEDGEGEREAPPPQLVKLRQSIQAKGAKGVGMVLGGVVLAIVVVALLLGGGGDNNSKASPSGGGTAPPTAAQPIIKRQLKALRQRLNSKNLPKPLKKKLVKELKALEKKAGVSSGGDSSKKKSESSNKKKQTPGEEGG